MSVTSPSITLDELISITQAQPKYNLIPIHCSYQSDLETPVSVFLKIRCRSEGAYNFLLESVEGGEWQTRYSFIGTEPYRIIQESQTDPLQSISSELDQYRIYPVPELPSFTGGGIGYIGYDCINAFEKKVPRATNNTLNIPDATFMFCHTLVVVDHVKHTIKLITHVRIDDETRDNFHALSDAYDRAITRLELLINKLKSNIPEHDTYHAARMPAASQSSELQSTMGQSQYESIVRHMKEHIIEGNIIQVVPSQRCVRPLNNCNAFDVYRQLRTINPSPYMFYLELGTFQIVGASPEQLVKIDEQRKVTTYPIAGTRKRGATPEEDAKLEQELLSSEKEKAEHIMLVDLGRNDIGKISVPGTVNVDGLMYVEKYSHVMHIVSKVSGQLRPELSVYDAFRSVFPTGTVSGAPKIRAMQLIAEAEQDCRNVYAGAVGYVSYAGVLDTAIAIRTMVVKDNIAYLQAGAGVVYDSDPTAEYKECFKKMKALEAAIGQAERVAAQTIAQAQNEQMTSKNGNGLSLPTKTDSTAVAMDTSSPTSTSTSTSTPTSSNMFTSMFQWGVDKLKVVFSTGKSSKQKDKRQRQ